jgi:beta-glucosidase
MSGGATTDVEGGQIMTIEAGLATAKSAADVRARETEVQMTDDERCSLVISVMGALPFNPSRDERIPGGTPMSAGYTSGVPRLGIPALLMSDASPGVTNPG